MTGTACARPAPGRHISIMLALLSISLARKLPLFRTWLSPNTVTLLSCSFGLSVWWYLDTFISLRGEYAMHGVIFLVSIFFTFLFGEYSSSTRSTNLSNRLPTAVGKLLKCWWVFYWMDIGEPGFSKLLFPSNSCFICPSQFQTSCCSHWDIKQTLSVRYCLWYWMKCLQCTWPKWYAPFSDFHNFTSISSYYCSIFFHFLHLVDNTLKYHLWVQSFLVARRDLLNLKRASVSLLVLLHELRMKLK